MNNFYDPYGWAAQNAAAANNPPAPEVVPAYPTQQPIQQNVQPVEQIQPVQPLYIAQRDKMYNQQLNQQSQPL